ETFQRLPTDGVPSLPCIQRASATRFSLLSVITMTDGNVGYCTNTPCYGQYWVSGVYARHTYIVAPSHNLGNNLPTRNCSLCLQPTLHAAPLFLVDNSKNRLHCPTSVW